MKKTKSPKEVEQETQQQEIKQVSPGKKFNKLFILVTLVVFAGIALLISLVLLLKLDAVVFPATMKGTVTLADGTGVSDVKVCVENKCSTTDDSGQYKLSGLKYGKNEVVLNKTGYKNTKYTTKLRRGDNSKDFILRVEGMLDFKGQFKTVDGKLIKDGFVLVTGEERYGITVKDDGSFNIVAVKVTTDSITVSSPNYKDKQVDVDFTNDEIDLGTITLEVAGEVRFTPVDWLSLEPLDEIKVTLKGNGEQFVLGKDGDKYIVNDLEIGKATTLIIEKSGYLKKNLNIEKLAQGTQDLEELEMVREGKLVYVSSRTGNSCVYIANYDGSEEKRLSPNKGNSYSPYYSKATNSVLFFSDYKNKKNIDGYKIGLLYKADITTGKITKLSKNLYEDYNGDVGTYNLMAGKRTFYEAHPDYVNTWRYMFGNTDGSGMKQIMHSKDILSNFVISDTGRLMMYSGSFKDKNDNGIYLYNTENGKKNRIFASSDSFESYIPITFSPDSKYGLFIAYEIGESDLYVRDFSKAETIRLTSNSTHENTPKFGDGSKVVSYISNRDNKSDIYMMNIEDRKETKITKDGNVNFYIWQNNLIFFVSENKIWVIDPFKPNKAQEITDKGFVSEFKTYNGYGWD